jgi:hypothetical protein
MPDKTSNIKLVMDYAWKALSILAIPALVWAWNLSTEVRIQQRDIQVLQQQAMKSQEHAIELGKLNTNIDNLRGSLNEIKEILRDID